MSDFEELMNRIRENPSSVDEYSELEAQELMDEISDTLPYRPLGNPIRGVYYFGVMVGQGIHQVSFNGAPLYGATSLELRRAKARAINQGYKESDVEQLAALSIELGKKIPAIDNAPEPNNTGRTR